MILDKRVMYSDAQAITASAASESYVDLGSIKNLGVGPQYLEVQVVEDFVGLTSLKVGFQTDDANTFGSPTTELETAAIPVASLKAGYKFRLALPPGVSDQYTRLYYTKAGDDATAGKVTAGIVMDGDAGEHPDLTV